MRCKRRIFPLASTRVRTFLLAPSRNFRHDNPVTSIRQRDSKDDPWRQSSLLYSFPRSYCCLCEWEAEVSSER